jgi:hypothetical protein
VTKGAAPARLRLLALMLATVPLGFGLKFWRGPGVEWW